MKYRPARGNEYVKMETLDSLVNYKLFCFGLNKDESLVGVGEEGAGDGQRQVGRQVIGRGQPRGGKVKSRRSCSLAQAVTAQVIQTNKCYFNVTKLDLL